MGKANPLEARLLALEREAVLRAADPIPRHIAGLTDEQRGAYLSPATYVLVIGGNQSGKTHWACLDACAEAVGLHPWAQAQVARKRAAGRVTDLYHWYGINTKELFAEQAWDHLKRFLLFEGESVHKLPTRRIMAISWDQKSGKEIPNYVKVKRVDGGFWHLSVKTYEAGRAAFQTKTVDSVTVDEECPNGVFEEIQARGLANPGFRVKVALTPVTGMGWVRRLKRDAIAAGTAEALEVASPGASIFQKPAVRPSISLHRLLTKDNPTRNAEYIAALETQYAGRPEKLALRLAGEDSASSGLVYPDTLFTPRHVIDDLRGQRPQFPLGQWTLHRCIDAGYRWPACVWIAYNARGRAVLYRCWKGENLRVAEAWAMIERLSGRERYGLDLIDPEVAATTPETGQPELSVWRKHGFRGTVAPRSRVWTGIEGVQDFMREVLEIPDEGAPGGSRLVPRFQVLASCREWHEEREEYKMRDPSERVDVDEPAARRGIVKRNDHLMDPTRLLVAAGLYHRRLEAPAPPKGTTGRHFWDQRQRVKNKGKRRL